MSALDTFLRALRTQESSGDYAAVNVRSGAAGAYQFEPGTWVQALTLAGLGTSVYASESAAVAPASVQDAAAAALATSYYNAYGQSWYNVAEAWYGGPGAVGHPDIGGGPGYPTVGDYAASVVSIYNSLGGTIVANPVYGVPALTMPITEQFKSDVGAHYSGITEPIWAKWSFYVDYTMVNIVAIPVKLV